MLSLVYVIIGGQCLAVISIALTRESVWWLLLVALLPLALVALDLLLFHIPPSLAQGFALLALVAVPLNGKFSTKWTLLAIWVVGVALLIHFQVSPISNVLNIINAACPA